MEQSVLADVRAAREPSALSVDAEPARVGKVSDCPFDGHRGTVGTEARIGDGAETFGICLAGISLRGCSDPHPETSGYGWSITRSSQSLRRARSASVSMPSCGVMARNVTATAVES